MSVLSLLMKEYSIEESIAEEESLVVNEESVVKVLETKNLSSSLVVDLLTI